MGVAFPALPLHPGLKPMEAKAIDRLPDDGGWQFEPKWDGFRCIAFKADGAVALQAKSGKPIGRFFPEVIAALDALTAKTFVLDGELIVPSASGFDFDALGQRIHPAASRIARLAVETPALYAAFDMLVTPRGRDISSEPLSERRDALERFCALHANERDPVLGPATRDVAQARDWLANVETRTDGVIAKRLADPYRFGERAMLKIKRRRTADCVVGGFRYASGKRDVGSLLLGLYDADDLHHVGFTSNIPKDDRAGLTRRLEALAGGGGFDVNVPGKPSRWARERSAEWTPIRAELVVEISYDQVTGRRLRHGSGFLRWRPDKRPDQCGFDQIE